MTPENKNLVVGLVVGFAWGLVVCSLAHAETPCTPPNPGMACVVTDDAGVPGSFWDIGAMQREDRERRERLDRMLSGESTPTFCERTMAEAMRAMEKYIPRFIDPAERRQWNTWPSISVPAICQAPFCQVPTLPDTRTLAEKLRDVQREYERHQEALGYQIVQDEQERWAYRQWDAAKACWMPAQ